MAMDGAQGPVRLTVSPLEGLPMSEGARGKELMSYEDEKHPSHSFTTLNDFRQSGFLCDFEVKVEERVFPCHRVVLAATIPYFRSMFSSEMKESRERAIHIRDISADAFEGILAFCYTSRLQICPDSVQQLLFAANMLQVDSVCVACEEFLAQSLTIQNCQAIRSLAEQLNCVHLMDSIDTFSTENFMELRKHPEFTQITFTHLRDLIKRSDLHVPSEKEVFESVVGWVEVDVDRRKEHLHALLSFVRLPQLNTAFLLERVKSHPLSRDDTCCTKLVLDAVHERNHSAGLQGGEAVVGLGWKNPAHPITSGASVDPVAAMAAAERRRPRKSAAGVVFCVGGRSSSEGDSSTVEAYDWRRDKWFPVKEMGVKRYSVGVMSADGKLYAIGGHDGGDVLASAECFDPAKNVWEPIASMGTQRSGLALGYLEGAIYAVGGWNDSNWGIPSQTVERYDIAADRWFSVAMMNVRRGGLGVATLGKYLYAVGGKSGPAMLDSVEKYDPDLDKWTLVSQMSHRRAYVGVAVLNGFLYAIGGFDGASILSSCERYDPVRNEWTVLPPMSCARSHVGVAAMGGRIYAVGGRNGWRPLDSVEAYDPVKNCWEPVASISHGRSAVGVAWLPCSVDTLQSVLRSSGRV